MYVCYVDEAGCTGMLPSATSNIQPAFMLVGLTVPQDRLTALTVAFLRLKKRFFPGLATGPQFLDAVRAEVKGNELRKAIASGARRERRQAIGFLDKTIELLNNNSARFFGRVYVKAIGAGFDGDAVYTYSVQHMAATFQHMLTGLDARGIIIADSRDKAKNATVSHSIFTQKYQTNGDPFGRILEMPTFGHSDNHVGLQISDLLCSAILWPMVMQEYCSRYTASVHIRPGYAQIRTRYIASLQPLLYWYRGPDQRWKGGISVSDPVLHLPPQTLFPFPTAPAATNVMPAIAPLTSPHLTPIVTTTLASPAQAPSAPSAPATQTSSPEDGNA